MKTKIIQQSTWHLRKQSLHECYKVYKEDIKFKTEKIKNKKTQKDEFSKE